MDNIKVGYHKDNDKVQILIDNFSELFQAEKIKQGNVELHESFLKIFFFDENGKKVKAKKPVDFLLPCPFCLELPVYYARSEHKHCVYCDASGKECPVNVETSYYETKEEAFAAWNKRKGTRHDTALTRRSEPSD